MNTPNPTRYLVTRHGPAAERKDYGAFASPELAAHVAQRASEKWPDATVVVEPIGGGK